MKTVMRKIVALCQSCNQCPVVEITDTEIKIGEVGNVCSLKPAEWESLRSKILKGEL